MPSTPNLIMEQPLRGTFVGTWDVPVNGNTGILDQAFGGVTTLALSSASVTMTTSQAQNNIIRLTGTLTTSITITMASIYKFWTIDNQLTNSPSSFAASLVSTAGTYVLGIAPGVNDILYDSSAIKYRNFGKLGEYWDYAATAVPTWNTLCTIPPWLPCVGTTFSSAVYPQLANLLGTTTLPDSRGRARYILNQGTPAFLTSSGAGIDGNTLFASGGNNGVTLGTSHIPTLTSVNLSQPISVSAITGGEIIWNGAGINAGITAGGGSYNRSTNITLSQNNSISVTYTNASQQIVANAAPGYVGGITMIKAV